MLSYPLDLFVDKAAISVSSKSSSLFFVITEHRQQRQGGVKV